MEFDLQKLMGEMPVAPNQQATTTGRVYTCVGVEAGGDLELKCNVDVAQAMAMTAAGPMAIAILVVRFAQKTTLSAPNFHLPEREAQVKEQVGDGLYRYQPWIIPLCLWGPGAYVNSQWEDQKVTEVLSAKIATVIKDAGGIASPLPVIAAVVERWTHLPTKDMDLFTQTMANAKKTSE